MSFGAALTRLRSSPSLKAGARSSPPLVIVTWTQADRDRELAAVFFSSPATRSHCRVRWPAVAVCAVLVMGMSGLLARASARDPRDISIVVPVFALSPIFTVLPDAALSGTWPSPLGWVGLSLSVLGTSTLSGRGTGWRGLAALFARRDALDALGAAVLLGLVAAVDRWGARAIGPASYLLATHGATAVLAGVIAVLTTPAGLAESVRARNVVTLVGHGLLGAAGTGMQTTALTMAPAAYVNAIRRMSSVVAVLPPRALPEKDLGRASRRLSRAVPPLLLAGR